MHGLACLIHSLPCLKTSAKKEGKFNNPYSWAKKKKNKQTKKKRVHVSDGILPSIQHF